MEEDSPPPGYVYINVSDIDKSSDSDCLINVLNNMVKVEFHFIHERFDRRRQQERLRHQSTMTVIEEEERRERKRFETKMIRKLQKTSLYSYLNTLLDFF